MTAALDFVRRPDGAIYASVAILFRRVAVLAAFTPARRAMRVDPM